MSIIGFLDNGATSYDISKAARAYENLCNSEGYHVDRYFRQAGWPGQARQLGHRKASNTINSTVF